MGWFQRLRGGVQPRDKPNEASKVEIAVGAKDDGRSIMTYRPNFLKVFSSTFSMYHLRQPICMASNSLTLSFINVPLS